MKKPLFQLLDSISYDKKDLSLEEVFSEYSPVVVNGFLASQIDCILQVNELNSRISMSKRMQYLYLLYSIRKKYRQFRFVKPIAASSCESLAKYYGVSSKVARSYIPLHSREQLEKIQSLFPPKG